MGSSLLLIGIGTSPVALASERDVAALECMKEAVKHASGEIAARYCYCAVDQLTAGSSLNNAISFCVSQERNRMSRTSPTNVNDVLLETIRQSGRTTREMMTAPNPFAGSTFQWNP